MYFKIQEMRKMHLLNFFVLVGGEITCKVQPNYVQIVKDVLKDIGYDRPELGTD